MSGRRPDEFDHRPPHETPGEGRTVPLEGCSEFAIGGGTLRGIMEDSQQRKAVLYAAKSTEDKHGSIPTQLEDGRALAAREGMEVVGEFQDEAASAYRGNRGPGLAAAIAECERSGAALVVQHSDRISRGDGRKGVKHLLHYALWALEREVTIHSVQDPQTFGDLLYTAVTGQRNHEDSARKSKAVSDGMRRLHEKAEPCGRVPDGYRMQTERDGRGSVVAREVVKDPDMEVTVERMFELALARLAPAAVARSLNAEGHRTAKGNPWRGRDVKRACTNSFYAGYVHREGDERPGDHPTYVTVEQHQLLKARMALKDAPAGRVNPSAKPLKRGGGESPGRRAAGHALCRLAVCDACGARMYSDTATRPRKDGSRKRTYVCANHRDSTGLCDVTVDAAAVDAEVLRWLDMLIADFDEWRSDLAAGVEEERRSAGRDLDAALAKLDELDSQMGKAEDDYARALDSDDETRAVLATRRFERMTNRRRGAAREVERRRSELAEFEGSTLTDAMLDMVNRIDEREDISKVNDQLRAEFEEFRIGVGEGGRVSSITPVQREPDKDLPAHFQDEMQGMDTEASRSGA